jgi:glycosyltransferase involved in cell wall biosynthesis
MDIIIVDDHSTDKTAEVAAAWASRDKRIRSLVLPVGTNGGAGQPTNRGIELCHNESKYLAFVDGDDYIAPKMYQKMVARAEKDKLDFAVANFKLVYDDPQPKRRPKENYDHKYWAQLVSLGKKVLKPSVTENLFRISPVPWRKLYSMDFIRTHQLRFPEGDYVFEDNAFHWLVTIAAQRVGIIDETFAFHRKGRAGQTMENIDNKQKDRELGLAGYFQNMNYVAEKLLRQRPANELYLTQFFVWVGRSGWILAGTRWKKKMKTKICSVFYRRWKTWLQQTPTHFRAKQTPPEWVAPSQMRLREIDISIVIPTHGAQPRRVLSLLKHLVSNGKVLRKKFEVIVVDVEFPKQEHSEIARLISKQANFFYLKQKSNKGKGRARNVAIPLVEGTYVWFLDPNDTCHLHALREAVDQAVKLDTDLMFMPYLLNTNKAGSPPKTEPMPADEVALWKRPKQTLEEKRRTAFALTSDSFVHLVKTQFMLDGDISFGPTTEHSELQLHWDAIAQARSISFFKKPVCIHTIDNRQQNKASKKVLANAMALTHRVLEKRGFFRNAGLAVLWSAFAKKNKSAGSRR